jgi:hypothetical protein
MSSLLIMKKLRTLMNMLRSLFTLMLLAFTGSFIQAQNTDSHSYDLSYGYNFYTSKFLRLNTTTEYSTNAPIRFVGFGGSNISSMERRPTKSVAITGQIQWYLPSRYTTDSVGLRISGFRFSGGFGTGLHTANHMFSIMACAGITSGRILIKGKEQGTKQNRFFCPKILLQPKVLLGPLALSVAGEYQYDITRVSWTNTRLRGKSTLQLPGFDQSGLSVYLCVGWHVGG